MSEIGYCNRGGMNGIVITKKEQVEFSNAIGTTHIDIVIPLPGLDIETQKKRIVECQDDHNEDEAKYWENEQGSHGWCCDHCGTVTQWG